MSHVEPRHAFRIWQPGRFRRNRRAEASETVPSGSSGNSPPTTHFKPFDPQTLKRSISSVGWAFRGYDQQNVGRSRELLFHPVYGSIVRETLLEVGDLATIAVGRPMDLVQRVESERPTFLEEFPEDVAMIVGMEWAQMRILREIFHVPIHQACLSIGYSIGELTALILGGTYRMDQLLPIPLRLADDCAALAHDAKMGVLFTRGPALKPDDVERMCREISAEGKGLIGPSAYLAPNTALLLGQGETLSRVEAVMRDYLPHKVSLRRNPNRWAPLHSPLVWRKNVPNRVAMMVYEETGGHTPPVPPVVSCVTGRMDYDGHNSRDMLIKWTDHPQRLWDAIDTMLTSPVKTIVHVGPAPNLIPSTFERLSNNVQKQLGHPMLRRLGHDVAHTLERHAWLAHLLPSKASLLRIPWIDHIILEDWLLEQPVSAQLETSKLNVEGRVAS